MILSSYERLHDALHSVFPEPVEGIVREFHGEEEWPKVEWSIVATIRGLFSSCCSESFTLKEALAKGDIPRAIIVIREGSNPVITGQEFNHLLTSGQLRVLKFILSQMRYSYPSGSILNKNHCFKNIIGSIGRLPDAFQETGVKLYMQFFPLCEHDVDVLQPLFAEDHYLTNLLKKNSVEACRCKSDESNSYYPIQTTSGFLPQLK